MAEGPYLMGIDGGTESVSTRVGVWGCGHRGVA
jgi:hypothetical protein